MKILVTGSKGQLGSKFINLLGEKENILGIDIQELDLTQSEEVHSFVKSFEPDVILHCAAYTNVDKAETDFEGAFKGNVIATQNIASAASAMGAKLVYFSTDFVFDGTSSIPYTEFNLPNPINNYGRTKFYGEQMVRMLCSKFFIVRTSWLYGDGENNFVGTMLRLAKNNEALKVVDDQIGSPTYVGDLAQEVYRLIRTQNYGIYHISNNGNTSWFEFAKRILEFSGLSVTVNPITSEQLNKPAIRPKYSVLSNQMLSMTIGDGMRDWEQALWDRIGKKNKRNTDEGTM